MGAISIRVFSSHPVAAADYARLLAHEKDFRLVADGELSQIGVFDSELASLDAVLTLTRLRAPTMRPLLLASPCDENECLRWLFRGVWGVVAYERYEENLPRAVRQVAEGQLWFPAPVVIRWMRFDAERRASAMQVSLTPREQEVLDFLLRRLSNKEIASILRISERTIKFHVGNIFHKLHVTSRQELSATCVPHLGIV